MLESVLWHLTTSGWVMGSIEESRGTLIMDQGPSGTSQSVLVHYGHSDGLVPKRTEEEVVWQSKLAAISSVLRRRFGPPPEPNYKTHSPKTSSEEAGEPIDALIDGIFGTDGILSRRFKDYSPRSGQIKMAHAVAKALDERRHVLVEAGTGTGKSFAAGIPAALYSATTGAPVVYVTANIALQEQLDKKDMPFIASLIDEMSEGSSKFITGIIKGMANYLCLMELEETEKHGGLPEPWNVVIPEWKKRTIYGDKSELAEEPPHEVWSKMSTTSEDCLRRSCAHFKECFVFANRRRLEKAHLIVTNYHFFFIDRMMSTNSDGEAGILPDYDFVICDEAHEMAEIAMDFRGYRITPGRWSRMSKFLNRAAIGGDRVAEVLREALEKATSRIMKHFQEQSSYGSVLELPLGFDGGLTGVLTDALEWAEKKVLEMKSSDEDDKILKARLVSTIEKVSNIKYEIGCACFGLVKHVVKDPLYPNEETEDLIVGNSGNLGVFPKNHVYYFDVSSKGGVSLACKVLDTQSFFRRYVFDPKVAVLTSATLSTNGSFKFITDQLGLKEEESEQLMVESPFKGSNMLVAIPSKGSFPEPDEAGFQQQIADTIGEMFVGMPFGGMLCLFTSNANLKFVDHHVQGDYRIDQSNVFVQGKAGKMQIIRDFKEAHERGEKALILATKSFWQGVDIPGQALSVVLIDKIPFSTPEDPVMWYLDRTTTTAFTKYAIPKAVIALKQAGGRLLRTIDDYGVVVLLDARASDRSKRYHKAVDSSFPLGSLTTENLGDVATFLMERAHGKKTG